MLDTLSHTKMCGTIIDLPPARSETVPDGLMHVVLMERGIASQSLYRTSYAWMVL
jgi:hypothetical protein